MNTELYPHQLDALHRMHNGCLLYGKVGCGKSRTALAYVFTSELGGSLRINNVGLYSPPTIKKDVYIITTAKKRDTKEWDAEVAYFCLDKYVKVTIDSWNNIKKYGNVYGATFIFDEQKVIGKGAWVKTFLSIAKKNHWILLSATPGDTWSAYIPVMIANGYYKNRTQFNQEHVVYKAYLKFPSIDHYIGTKKLKYIAEQILVKIEYENKAQRHSEEIVCDYDKKLYKDLLKERWDFYDNCPIEETGKLAYLLRRASNDNPSRYLALEKILKSKTKVIVFYNFNYELYGLREFFKSKGYEIGECNGECHTEIPTREKWAYLVQYMSGCEGWNCTQTDTIIFFSQNYSYTIMEQAAGRIDRANTPYKDLYYYYLRSMSPMDVAIRRALNLKQTFNEKIFMKGVVCN